MRPEANAQRLLSVTRAKAKMFEYGVPLADHIGLPQHPSTMFALAVGLLGDAAAQLAADWTGAWTIAVAPLEFEQTRPESWSDTWDPGDRSDRETSRQNLRFSATYFDAFIDSRLDEEITTEFSVLCAAAYYLAGNPGSGSVVAKRSNRPHEGLGGGLATLVHSILNNNFTMIVAKQRYTDIINRLLQTLRAYYAVEAPYEAVRELCRELRADVYRFGTSAELLYADIAVALFRDKLDNSARVLLPIASGLQLSLWQPTLTKPHFPRELWPAQKRICDAGTLGGKSAVIQMPTSAGKTKATELIIRSGFLSGRTSLAVIVAPYRSLCHDIRGDLVKAFAGEEVFLDEMSDNYRYDIQLDRIVRNKSVIVVTPEKLLYLIRRSPEISEEIGLIIYDEGHQFDSMARGPTFELLLSSLKISLRSDAQVVLISAVIANAADVAEWLIRDRTAVIHGQGLQPTAKSIAFASWHDLRGQLQYVAPDNPEDTEFFVPRVIESNLLNRLPRERADRHFPKKEGPDIGLYLGLKLSSKGSVAIFCGRKSTAAKLCERAVELCKRKAPFPWPSKDSDQREISSLHDLFEKNLGSDAAATKAAALGIFPHHANIPRGLRLCIEHAMKEGSARFIICTSTVAQGVNFPIRYLIVTGVNQGSERIMVRDFHNLIGRAGRAGMHTEGSIIFSATEIFDGKRNMYENWRWRGAKELLDPAKSEPCASSILRILDSYEQDRPPVSIELTIKSLATLLFIDEAGIDEIVAQETRRNSNLDKNQFRRFIQERAKAVQSISAYLLAHVNLTNDNYAAQISILAANTLAYQLASSEQQRELLQLFGEIAETLKLSVKSDEMRVLIRKSPLSPASIAALQKWLAASLDTLFIAAFESRLLEAICDTLIAHTSSQAIRAVSDRAAVKDALTLWVEGKSYDEIMRALSGRGVRVGNHEMRIEDVVAMCEDGFGYDAAMVLASMVELSEPLDNDVSGALAVLQKEMKYGLSDRASIAFFEAGFADRIVAQALGRLFPKASERADIRRVLRQSRDLTNEALEPFPSYFQNVAQEIAPF